MIETKTSESYRCRKCGLESTVKEAFIIPKGSSGKADKALCFECVNKQRANSLLIQLLIVFVLGLFLSFISPGSSLGRFYLLLCASFLLLIPLIILHELAHAIVSRLLGFRVYGIHLGAGKVIFSTRFLGLRWYLRPIPLGGATLVAGPEVPFYRGRKFLIHMAGPGVHALLALLLVIVLPEMQADSLAYLIIQLSLWSNIFLLVVNLFPRKIATSVGIAGTDGWAMLHIFRKKPEELRKGYAQYYEMEVVDAVDRGDKQLAAQRAHEGLALYPQELNLINAAGYVYLHLGEFKKARAAFVQILASENGLTEGIKYIAMNNVAYANIMLEDPALIPEADEYSALAYKNFAWEPLIGGTRGAVLVSMGQIDEGIELLKNAMARSFDRRAKAADACLVARGEMKRGNSIEAKKYLDAARQLDPECLLLERVSREVEQD